MADDSTPTRREQRRVTASRRWLEVTDDRHVFIAPLLSLVAFALIAVGDATLVARILAMLVQIALFQIVVTAHIRSARLRRLLLALIPVVIIVAIVAINTVSYLIDSSVGQGITSLFSAGLAIGVMVRLFGLVARAPVITLRVVGDAIAVYLMMGLTFAYVYLAIDAFRSDDFFAQGPQPAYVFLYFSYITLATVGYGDFTAADAPGRLLSMFEGLVGQLYLVTVLALIVSNLGRTRDPQATRARMREGAEGPEGAADGGADAPAADRSG
jgi:hypothetical protein